MNSWGIIGCRKQNGLVIKIDLEKAYDKVDWQGMLSLGWGISFVHYPTMITAHLQDIFQSPVAFGRAILYHLFLFTFVGDSSNHMIEKGIGLPPFGRF